MKILEEKIIVASRGRNKDNPSDRTPGNDVEQRIEPNSQGICNTLTSVQKDNYVMERAILTPKRTDYGKQIRKAYENGQIRESRHNMTQLEPRSDGIANTLTTVQKDNFVMEKTCIGGLYTNVSPDFQKGVLPKMLRCLKAEKHDAGIVECIYQRPRGNNKGGIHTISPTITSCSFHENNFVSSRRRIRKLIPREYWRLMDFTDEDFEKAESVNSNSQLYHQAGNSIVKAVMMGIMSQLNIKGIVPWNEVQK